MTDPSKDDPEAGDETGETPNAKPHAKLDVGAQDEDGAASPAQAGRDAPRADAPGGATAAAETGDGTAGADRAGEGWLGAVFTPERRRPLIVTGLLLCAAAILAVSAYYYGNREAAAVAARAVGDPLVELPACDALDTVADQNACRLRRWEAAAAAQREVQILRAQQDMAAWSLGLLLLGVASVIVTALGVLFVALTLRETRRATQAALDGAKAASETVEVTREIGKKQVRAYVNFDMSSLPSSVDSIGAMEVGINLYNSGHSPALKVRVKSALGVFATDDDALVPETTEDALSSASEGVLHSNAVLSVFSDCKNSPSQLKSDGFNKYILYCYCKYRDVFDEDHRSSACFIGELGRSESALSTQITWSIYRDLNEAD